MNSIKKKVEGGVVVHALLWMAGAPFVLVVILWALFFRGH